MSTKAPLFGARAGFHCVLALLTGVIVGETLTSVNHAKTRQFVGSVDTRTISNGITAVSVTVWPILWDAVVGMQGLLEQPRLSIGFFWPVVMACIDLKYTMDARTNAHDSMTKLSKTLAANAQSIISAGFALGALMSSSSLRSIKGVHLIMYALIACLALVIPQVSTPESTPDRVAILSAQKAALNYAIGFIVSGIGADFLKGGAKKKIYGTFG